MGYDLKGKTVKRVKDFEMAEKLASVVVGIIGCAAILWALAVKGVTSENILDAVKDIAGLAAIFIAVILAIESKAPKSFLEAAEQALIRLRRTFPAQLTGPQNSTRAVNLANKKSPETDKGEVAETSNKYLFFHKNEKYKAQIVPLSPLEFGVLSFQVSATTMKALGFDKYFKELAPECRSHLSNTLIPMLEKKYPNVKVLEVNGSHKNADHIGICHDSGLNITENTALTIKFDENMKIKSYGKAVEAICREAVDSLNQFSKDNKGRIPSGLAEPSDSTMV